MKTFKTDEDLYTLISYYKINMFKEYMDLSKRTKSVSKGLSEEQRTEFQDDVKNYLANGDKGVEKLDFKRKSRLSGIKSNFGRTADYSLVIKKLESLLGTDFDPNKVIGIITSHNIMCNAYYLLNTDEKDIKLAFEGEYYSIIDDPNKDFLPNDVEEELLELFEKAGIDKQAIKQMHEIGMDKIPDPNLESNENEGNSNVTQTESVEINSKEAGEGETGDDFTVVSSVDEFQSFAQEHGFDDVEIGKTVKKNPATNTVLPLFVASRSCSIINFG